MNKIEICPSCKLEKPLIQSWRCRDCYNIYKKEYYLANKERINALTDIRKQENYDKIDNYLQTHPCVDCGNSDLRCLAFDHVRGTKKLMVSHMMHYSWLIIEKEIEKCEVRCFNCHEIRHYEERQQLKDLEVIGKLKGGN